MKGEKIILVLSLVFLSIGFISSTTYITDNYINTSNLNFNVTGGSFAQNARILSEVGYIQDDSQTGGTATALDKPRSVYVQGGYAYVASNAEDSLSIYDISNPSNISEVGYIEDDSQAGDAACLNGAQRVFVNGNYAYVLSQNEDSLSIYDISNPSNISEVSCIKDGVGATCLDGPSGLYVAGQYVYVTSGGDDGFSIIDVSDIENPVETFCIQDDDSGGSATTLDSCQGVDVQGKYAYVVSRLDSALNVFDISNPNNATLVSYIQDNVSGGVALAMEGAKSVKVSGNYAYVVANSDDALTILDISNKSNLSVANYIQDDSRGGTATVLGGCSYLDLYGNYVYVEGKDDNGISLFDVSNPYAITVVQTTTDDGTNFHGLDYITDFAVSGEYLYMVSETDDTFAIIGVSGFDIPGLKTGTIETSVLSVDRDAKIFGNVFIGNNLHTGFNGFFGGFLSVYKNLKVFGNLTIGTDTIFANSITEKVGINTTTPSHTLNVVGDANITKTLNLGDGANQVNITLTSPDGTEWCCGVDNAGSFNCSSGAC